MTGFPARPVIERLLEKVEIEVETGCWLWVGGTTGQGYGKIRVGSQADGTRRIALAHRVAYEEIVGPVPEGTELDHTCHNDDQDCPGGKACTHRRCICPEHLEPVTHHENTMRGRSIAAAHAAKTHCPKGHAYEGANLVIDGGSRKCRTCRNAATARRARRRRAQSLIDAIGVAIPEADA